MVSAHFSTFHLPLYNEFTRPLPPDVTHTLISSFLYISMPGLVAPMLASIRFAPPVPDRQTLRVFGEIAQGCYDCASDTASRVAKRYMCASSVFPAVETIHYLPIWTRRRPPNVTHVTFSAFRRRFHETLNTQWFPCLFRRKMHLLGPLWEPNLRGRRVWRSCLFATCFQIVCCFKNHQQTQAETLSWLWMDTKYAQA